MGKITVPLEVEQASYELGEALGKTAKDLVIALKSNATDFGKATAILTAITGDLVPVLSDFGMLSADLKESPEDFMAAWMKSGLDAWKALTEVA